MVVEGHRGVIEKVVAAAEKIYHLKTNHFDQGVCFGYACSFLEAIHSNGIDEFLAALNGNLDMPTSYYDQLFVQIAIHQSPYLFPDQIKPGKNIYIQDISGSSKMTHKGGVLSTWKYSGAYDLAGIRETLAVFLALIQQHDQSLHLLVDGGKHTIALVLERDCAVIGTVEKPGVKLVYRDLKENIDRLAVDLIEYILQGKCASQAHLVVNWSLVSCVESQAELKPLLRTIDAHPHFHQAPSKYLIECKDIKNRWWIIGALKSENEEMVRSMILVYPQVKSVIENERNLITYCAYLGLYRSAKALLEAGFEVDEQDEQGNQALLWAIFNYHLELIKLLLNYGADIHKKNLAGESPIVYAYRRESKKGIPPSQSPVIQELEKPIHSPSRL